MKSRSIDVSSVLATTKPSGFTFHTTPYLPPTMFLQASRSSFRSIGLRGMATVSSSRISFKPLDLPKTANPSKFQNFGKRVIGYNPEDATKEEVGEIQKALYEVCRVLLWIRG